MSQEKVNSTEARLLLASLLHSFSKRAAVYHWRVDGNDATLPSLLRISAWWQYLDVMSFCGFYDKEKGSFFHAKFNNFLSSHHIQSANKFSRKNKNGGGRDVGWYLRLDESTNRCKDESSIVPNNAKAQLDHDIVATEENGRMPRVLKKVREINGVSDQVLSEISTRPLYRQELCCSCAVREGDERITGCAARAGDERNIGCSARAGDKRITTSAERATSCWFTPQHHADS